MLRGDDAYFGNVTEGDAEQTGMRRLSSPAMLPPAEELGYSEGSPSPRTGEQLENSAEQRVFAVASVARHSDDMEQDAWRVAPLNIVDADLHAHKRFGNTPFVTSAGKSMARARSRLATVKVMSIDQQQDITDVIEPSVAFSRDGMELAVPVFVSGNRCRSLLPSLPEVQRGRR